MSLTELSKETFVQYFGGLYEGAPWVAERVYDSGLTASNDDAESLAEAFETVVENSSLAEKLQLIRNHPDLVGRNALKRKLSDASKLEQASASLDQCTPQQFERFHELNKLYWARFGFPFVVAVRDSEPAEILAEFTRRIARSKDEEFDEALLEAKKIARWRLRALLNGDTGESIGGVTQVQANDVNSIASTHFPGALAGLFLGVQHVLAMFVSNVTPAIIIAGAVGFGFGSADTSDMIYLIQMSMFFAGIATLIQTITLGPIGARLPIMQGTSFAFIPVMIPIGVIYGMPALMGGIIIGGVFHFILGTFVGKVRSWLPPLVTGLVVLMIGLALIKVGIQYAAGGVPLIGTAEFGSLPHWTLALLVITVTLLLKFFAHGLLSMSAILIGLLSGYALAVTQGMVDFSAIERAQWLAYPNPLHFGFEIKATAVIGMCLMSFVSAIETVGDISATTKSGAGRDATDRELRGGTMADGLGTALAGCFGALPNTSFSQNVGLISITGVMNRHVVTIAALFLVACGLVPKIGAAIQTMPIAVLGGGVIVMFGMVASAGVNILAGVRWTQRNLLIFGLSLSVGLGLQLEPASLQHLPETVRLLMATGLLPAALIAILLNRLLPENTQLIRT